MWDYLTACTIHYDHYNNYCDDEQIHLEEIIYYLLSNEWLDVNEKFGNDNETIIFAALNSTKIVKELVEKYGADVNIRNSKNKTLMSVACHHGFVNTILYLSDIIYVYPNDVDLLCKSFSLSRDAKYFNSNDVFKWFIKNGLTELNTVTSCTHEFSLLEFIMKTKYMENEVIKLAVHHRKNRGMKILPITNRDKIILKILDCIEILKDAGCCDDILNLITSMLDFFIHFYDKKQNCQQDFILSILFYLDQFLMFKFINFLQ